MKDEGGYRCVPLSVSVLFNLGADSAEANLRYAQIRGDVFQGYPLNYLW